MYAIANNSESPSRSLRVEASGFWRMRQRYAIAVYGSVVYTHALGSTAQSPKLQHCSCINLSEIREQTAEASNLMLDSALHHSSVSAAGSLLSFSDCGPHFRSGANLARYIHGKHTFSFQSMQIMVDSFGN